MRLSLLVPDKVLLRREVTKLTVEGGKGPRTILPHHIDFCTALEPGLLFYETPESEEIFYAVDEGILVKRGKEVRVSTFNAMRGPELGSLRQAVEKEFEEMEEREARARRVLRRLEADFTRRYVHLGEDWG